MSNKLWAVIAALALPLCAAAQGSDYYADAEPTFAVNGRMSASVDWKVFSGFHMELSEEARLADGFAGLDKLYSTLGCTYKISPWLKAGASYSLINVKKDNEDDYAYWRNRGRFCVDLTESVKRGDWKFSLRERFQCTSKYYQSNIFQTPSDAMALRLRAKASRAIPGKPLHPYTAAEVRYELNAVDPSSLSTLATGPYTVKYTRSYIDRCKAELGVEWRVNKQNWLDFYLLGQYDCNEKIDANAKGKLKKLSANGGGVVTRSDWTLSLGVAYRFGL